jgi:predicted dehydrogenase
MPEAQLLASPLDLIANAAIQAVFVCTPSHLHRDLVVRCLAEGKHVYCEAPIATSIEAAGEIVRAARDAWPRWHFQAGLQGRCDPQRKLVAGFLASGVAGRLLFADSQWAHKASWRQAGASAERREELNWRLDSRRSLGLAGEVAIHSMDAANWFFGTRPIAVSGQGACLQWADDGRDVDDTVHWVMEYPGGVTLQVSCRLGSSFGGDTELMHRNWSGRFMPDKSQCRGSGAYYWWRMRAGRA